MATSDKSAPPPSNPDDLSWTPGRFVGVYRSEELAGLVLAVLADVAGSQPGIAGSNDAAALELSSGGPTADDRAACPAETHKAPRLAEDAGPVFDSTVPQDTFVRFDLVTE